MSGLKAFIQGKVSDLNISLPDLAERAGMPTSTLYKVLDQPDVPKMRTLDTIAKALGEPLGVLIEACGYSLDAGDDTEDEARARALMTAIPELREIVGPMVGLTAENRGALMAIIRAFVAQVEGEKPHTRP